MNKETYLRLQLLLLTILLITITFLYISERSNFKNVLTKYCEEVGGEPVRTFTKYGCKLDPINNLDFTLSDP